MRIDGAVGRPGDPVNAILEADIRDTGTGSRIVLRAPRGSAETMSGGTSATRAGRHRLEEGHSAGRQAAAFVCQDE